MEGVVGIPVYMPLTIDVAVGFLHGTIDEFHSWMEAMKQQDVKAIDRVIKPCTGIKELSQNIQTKNDYIQKFSLSTIVR